MILKGQAPFNIFYFELMTRLENIISALYRNLMPSTSDIYRCVNRETGVVDMIKMRDVAKTVVNREIKQSDECGGWGSQFNLNARNEMVGNVIYVLYMLCTTYRAYQDYIICQHVINYLMMAGLKDETSTQ